MTSLGINRRMKRLFSNPSGKILLVPIDDSLISGPISGLENLTSKVELIIKGNPDVVMGFPGLFRICSDIIDIKPSILNLTASTTRSHHTRKVLVGSVEQAIRLGLEGVAVHVNISSKY